MLRLIEEGITELSHPTSILTPTYTYHNVVLDCVPNLPESVPKTVPNY